MKKTDANKLARLLEGLSKGKKNESGVEVTVEELVEQTRPLQSQETQMYINQSILNFYAARVKPMMYKGESEVRFDLRYREWRFQKCKQCDEEYAYAWSFSGVAYCSLRCTEKALQEIGISMQRDRDLTLRYGVYSHPAIVPPDALKALKDQYQTSAPLAFSGSE